MNVTRSTLMRRGYLLTALTVAALLAGSAGSSAWAQTIGFSTSRGTLQEGATIAANTEDPLTVFITRSGDFDADDGDSETEDTTFEDWGTSNNHVLIQAVEYDGTPSPGSPPFTFKMRSGDSATQSSVTLGNAFRFGAETARPDGIANRIELTIEHVETGDQGDWNNETLVLKVVADPGLVTHLNENKLSYRTQELTVTVIDNEPMPVLKFTPGSIQLAKDNTRTVSVGVGTGAGGTGALSSGMRTALNGLTTGKNVVLSVSPVSAVGDLIEITYTEGGEKPPADGRGGYIIGTIGGIVAAASDDDGIDLNIKALRVSGFRDEMISLTLADGRREAEQEGDGGGIEASAPATVTILSGEETPTVTFSTESVTMNEGDTETVHLLADGEQGDQVGAVAISVSGDATIVLEQGGSPISGGVVQFGDSANAELTIRSLEDLRLEDGEEKMATVTITDASGANIGDPRTLTVTVVGSTAVPVLPLVGQLLLGLLLTAGGTRLYRRRQR